MNPKTGPVVVGCEGCKVPDRIARQWPEAHRALANRLSSIQGEDGRIEAVVK